MSRSIALEVDVQGIVGRGHLLALRICLYLHLSELNMSPAPDVVLVVAFDKSAFVATECLSSFRQSLRSLDDR